MQYETKPKYAGLLGNRNASKAVRRQVVTVRLDPLTIEHLQTLAPAGIGRWIDEAVAKAWKRSQKTVGTVGRLAALGLVALSLGGPALGADEAVPAPPPAAAPAADKPTSEEDLRRGGEAFLQSLVDQGVLKRSLTVKGEVQMAGDDWRMATLEQKRTLAMRLILWEPGFVKLVDARSGILFVDARGSTLTGNLFGWAEPDRSPIRIPPPVRWR